MGTSRCRALLGSALLLFIIWPNPGLATVRAQEEEAYNLEVGVLSVCARNAESNSSLVALRHLLDEVGVPYRVLEPTEFAELDPGASLPAVLVDSYLGAGTLLPNEISAIKQYVQRGGILIAVKPEESNFGGLFGFSERRVSNQSYFLAWSRESLTGAMRAYVDQPEERLIQFASRQTSNLTFVTTVFRPSTAEPLADFLDPDGVTLGAAILRNQYGLGITYVLGIGWTDSILAYEMMRNAFAAYKSRTNVWRPYADVIRLFVLGALQNAVEHFVFKYSVPFGYKSALLLSHDIDARIGYDSLAVEMALMESQHNVTATYFLTTRYFGDKIDRAYWKPETVQRLVSLGMTIGSHGVSHYENFTYLPQGTNQETQATYLPNSPATVSGEVGVSAEMLRPYGSDISWRSPGLLNNRYLTFYLQKNGYEFQNVSPAMGVATNFPYVMMLNRTLNYESTVFEFPLALGDIGLNETNTEAFVDSWKEVIKKNRDNGAPSAILVHPTSYAKVNAAKEIIEWALLEGDIWVTDWVSFMRFWKLRHTTTLEGTYFDGAYSMNITNHGDSYLRGLSLAISDLEAPLQIPAVPAEKSLAISLTPKDAFQLAVGNASTEIQEAQASIASLKAANVTTVIALDHIENAQRQLSAAKELLYSSPTQALHHARIAAGHAAIAAAAEYEYNSEPEEVTTTTAIQAEQTLSGIDLTLLVVTVLIYGTVLVRRSRKRRT